VHRFLPNYVIRMWMAAPSGGLAAVLYGASTVRARVGLQGQTVEIRQQTDYPFGEEIHFTVDASEPVTFPLWLRIPRWCKSPRLALNGRAVPLSLVDKGFIRLERTFQPGDRLVLTLPMRTTLTFWPGNGIGVEHGPLVYSLPVKEDWASLITPKWSTTEFPEWDAKPSGRWNYGTAVDEDNLVSAIQVTRRAMTADPWVDPPVTLLMPLKAISGWDLQKDPQHPERQQTPPLPEIDPDGAKELAQTAVEHLALVPYGTTQLRVTIFPNAATPEE
jgi:hypothetical protein